MRWVSAMAMADLTTALGRCRQTFLIYYLPAYYFAILLAARAWHHAVCRTLPPPLASSLTACVCAAVGWLSWRIAPLAYASPTGVAEWSALLRLASAECWGTERCWAHQA